MDLNHVLNALVTSLSLATILVTLMSFLIFKIRQFPKKGSESSTRHEGLYFRKYDPFSQPLPDAATRNAVPTKPPRFNIRWSIPAFFGGVSVAIFAAIFVQGLVSPATAPTPVAAAPSAKPAAVVAAATPAAARFDAKKLEQMGLAQKVALNASAPNSPMQELISEGQVQDLAAEVALLKGHRIAIIKESDAQQAAVAAGWEQFLTAEQIPFTSSSLFKVASNAEVVILPQMTTLNARGRAFVEDFIRRGVGVLATGPLAMSAPISGKPWLDRYFGVSFQPNPTPNKTYPLMFAADRAPFAPVPPGFTTEWFPTDNRVNATATAALAVETDNTNLPRSLNGSIARAVFNEAGAARTAWMAQDPGGLAALPASQQHYGKAFLVSSLRWLTHAPYVRVSSWKKGAQTAFLASVDSEDKFEGATNLMHIFREKHFPASFFIVANLLLKEPGLAKEADATMDLASHTTDHAMLDGKPAAFQFERIDNARIAIESIAERKVVGFRPPEERFDETTLNVAAQEHVSYFFGDQRFYRFAPVVLDSSHMTYFPRSVVDDFNLLATYPGVPAAMTQKMQAEFERVASFGGAYFFSAHSQVFGQPNYQSAASDFLDYVSKQDVWRANFAEMTTWWHDRADVHAELSKTDSKELQLKITNSGAADLNDVAFILDAADAANLKPTDAATKFELTKTRDVVILNLPQLAAHEQIAFTTEGESMRGPSSATTAPPTKQPANK